MINWFDISYWKVTKGTVLLVAIKQNKWNSKDDHLGTVIELFAKVLTRETVSLVSLEEYRKEILTSLQYEYFFCFFTHVILQ